ncbi:AraC family transcriptional regulator [Sphaerotilus sp.]|uniref:helix-turn-helix transcriptional regulator n=1 Tax=Sphaerotilus sp. TaxID=2093942 RepID=UPI002ACD96EF|nr:AraC family transcriptional regulator [Sphaerotilus sp.]MDZ7855892.1 AraC family transcriptional regulator [Sphaerotilus sp.]
MFETPDITVAPGAEGPQPRSSATYDAGFLARAFAHLGGSYRVNGPGLCARAPVLAGRFDLRQLRHGMSLHCTDTQDLQTLSTEVEQEPGLGIVILLAGRIDASLGARALRLDDSSGPTAALTSLAEPDRFVRHAQRGRHARKVSIGIDAAWLEANGAAAGPAGAQALALLRTHLAQRAWRPSARAASLAEQLVHPPALEPLLLNLYLESRALDLVVEALGSLAEAPNRPSAALRPRDLRRLQDFIAWLDSGEADGLSLSEMAHRAGLNTTTLQQRFRDARGCSIVEFLRKRRLAAARHALEQQGLTVGQAAELAGYASAANFATAFKRQFGLQPHRCRASL